LLPSSDEETEIYLQNKQTKAELAALRDFRKQKEQAKLAEETGEKLK